MPVWATKNSFNAGEISPKMIARTDVSQYAKACRKLMNFRVTPYGSIERRRGFQYRALISALDEKCRIIPFVFSQNISYLLVFIKYKLEIYKVNADSLEQVRFSDNNFWLASPYSANELEQLKYVQSADVMTLVHPKHPPMELKRTADGFLFAVKEYKHPPMLEPNLDDENTIHYVPETVVDDMTIPRRIVAAKDTFTKADIGSYIQLIYARDENKIEQDFTKNGISKTLEVYGYWTFITHGTWTGSLTIERSFDNGVSWIAFRTYSSAKDNNVSDSGDETEKNVLYRLKMENYVASTTGTIKKCQCIFTNPAFMNVYTLKIVQLPQEDVVLPRTVHVEIVDGSSEPPAEENTTEWNMGAWSDGRGYPASISFFEERMFFGGTAHNPNTIWGSKTNAWDDFLLSDEDDAALQFTIASDTVNAIKWMVPHDSLIIGAVDSEWTLSASDSDKAVTPSDFKIRRQSVYGAADIQPVMVGDVLLFVQQGRRKIREFVYSWEKDGYSSPDMTVLAEHITAPGVREICLQQLPDNNLYCLLDDGSLAVLNYERDQDVVGWYKINTDGEIISIASLPYGDEQILFAAIRRHGKLTIEALHNDSGPFLDLVFSSKEIYSASGRVYCVLPEALADKEAVLMLNGVNTGMRTAEGWILYLDDLVTQRNMDSTPVKLADYSIDFGLPYESICQPIPIEIDNQDGSTLFRRKTVGEVRIRYYDSIGGELRCNNSAWQDIAATSIREDEMDSAISPKSGTARIVPLAGYNESIDIEIRQKDPFPLNICALSANYEVSE